MALKSIDFPLVDSNQLLQISDSVRGNGPNGEILSAVDEFKAIDPARAFPPQDMFALKANVAQKLTELSASDSAAVGNLSSNIDNLSTSELSTALFDSGIDPESFSVEDFDLSAQGLTDLNSAIDAFKSSAAGGCDALLSTLAGAKTPKEISLETFDVDGLASSFSGAIQAIPGLGTDLNATSITADAEKTVSVFLQEAEAAAKAAETEIISQVDSFASIDTASLRTAALNKTQAIKDVFDSNITSLLSGVQSQLSGLKSTTESCCEDAKKATENKMKNLDKNIDGLPNKVNDVSAVSLEPTMKQLKDKVARTKSLVSEENNKKRETITAALIKKMQENNPQADAIQIEQSVKNMVAKANKQSDEKVKRESDIITNLVNQASAKFKDVTRASNERASGSATAGRPVAEKTSIISSFASFTLKEQVFDASYFFGPYAKKVAEAVNTLHPKLRLRFANAIKDVQYNEEVLAMNGTAFYSFALRSFSAQADLRRAFDAGGARAAKPGNSWHDFGCACDIVFVVNGQPKYDEKFYTGLIRKEFVKQNLENNFSNDPQHFQPKEFRTQGVELPQTIKTKIVKNGVVDKKVVATYIS